MRKSWENLDKTFLFKVNSQYLARLEEIWRGRYQHLSEGIRALIRAEIQRHGPMPKDRAKREVAVKSEEAQPHTD